MGHQKDFPKGLQKYLCTARRLYKLSAGPHSGLYKVAVDATRRFQSHFPERQNWSAPIHTAPVNFAKPKNLPPTKSLYGMQQAPLLWFSKPLEHLLDGMN